MKTKKLKLLCTKKNIMILIAIIICALIIESPIKKIDIGYEGVLYNNIKGEIVSQNVGSGVHVVIPLIQELIEYPINEKTYIISRKLDEWNKGIDKSIIAPTSTYETVSVDVSVIYQLDATQLDKIYYKYDGKGINEIESNYLDGIITDSVINITTEYTPYDIYSTKRKEIEKSILEHMQSLLINTGIEIKRVWISEVRLSEEIKNIIKSTAIAEADRIEAKGKSDANNIISETLTDNIMSYETINKLSDKIQIIVVPSGSQDNIDISRILTEGIKNNEESSKQNE